MRIFPSENGEFGGLGVLCAIEMGGRMAVWQAHRE